ncbi:MAG: hypothetical protein ACRD26_05200 [Vicinamibacterales bacterium]
MLTRALLAFVSVYVFGHWLAGLSVAVLFVIWDLLKAEEGPPVLALAMTTQWLQVSGGIFYTGLTGRPLEAIENSDWEPMVLMGLGCVTALTLGVWFGMRLVRRRMSRPEYAPEELVGWRLLLMAYGGTLVTTGVLQELAWAYLPLTQAILAITFAHLAIVFLLLRRLTRPAIQGGGILMLLGFEVALGFTGYFSHFKEPLLLAAMAVLEVFDRRRTEHWVAAGALALTLSAASVMWMGVRTEYRRDFLDDVFARSRSVRLQRMQALTGDWLANRDERVGEDMDLLMDRAWAIYYPALAVARVPAALPHTGGALVGGALYHIVTPRILFPDKPDLPSDSELVRKYAGVWVAGADEGTSIAFGYAAESYVDFGVPVMFVPVVLLGVFCGVMYEWFLRVLHHRELAVSLVTVVFWMNLYLFERSWARTLGLSITMMVYLGGLGFLIDRWLLMRHDRQADEGGLAGSAVPGFSQPPPPR